jgi:dihydroxyacetone kinase DhaKLM complex PTS-EIIA-like component DhaM
MEQYFNALAIPIIIALAGAIIYVAVMSRRDGLHNVKEKEAILVMLDVGGLNAAVRIVMLALNSNTIIDSNIDRIYLVIGAFVTALISYKDLLGRFKVNH